MLHTGFARGTLIHAEGALTIKPMLVSAQKEPAEGFHKTQTSVFSCVPKASYDCSRGEQV